MTLGDMLRTDLVKTLSALFLFALVMCALAIAVYDKVTALPIDSTVQAVLASAISVALANLGFNHGVTVANGVAQSTAAAVIQAQNGGGKTDGSSPVH